MNEIENKIRGRDKEEVEEKARRESKRELLDVRIF